MAPKPEKQTKARLRVLAGNAIGQIPLTLFEWRCANGVPIAFAHAVALERHTQTDGA